MLGALEDILCWISELPQLILVGIVKALNVVIAGVGAALDGLVALLPGMPTTANFLPESVISTANWFYPFGALVDAIGVIAGMWLVFLVVKIALSWVKVLNAG